MLGFSSGKGSLDNIIKDKGITATRDPRRVSQLGNMAVGKGELHICEVHDVLAYANSYIVKAAGMPHMPACLLSSTSSFLPLGGRDCATIMPGALVLCLIDEQYPMAMIIGVLPTPMGGANLGLPDCIVAAGHAGLFVDSAHYGALQQKSGHGFLDLSVGRPVDGLPGDWGFLNELGLGIFVGKLMSFLRAGDFCKFEVNYEDQLARIAAFNWEHFTAGSETQAFNDEGEWTDVHGFNPYPWEAAGILQVNGEPFKLTGAELTGDNEEFGLEPQEQMQTGFWRFRTFDGFLGDLRRNIVTAPVPELETMTFDRSITPYYGLLDERYGADGSYKLRSAKSISFEKTVYIPVPYPKFPRDNPLGDTDFDDGAGVGSTYNMDELPAPDSASEAVAGLNDKHAFDDQHLTQEGVNLRSEDWGVEDPPRLPGEWDKESDNLKPYTEFEAPIPITADIEIDHRGSRRYYKSSAYFDILDDGSIVMVDAYGSSIKMSGGNIEFSCPGSITTRPGRDAITMSGQDTIIKANNDIDITSAEGSVRQKAEINFMILGGNKGSSGGVLIENRATGVPDFESAGENVSIGGLILKSAAGDVTVWGKAINMQSLTGDITMEANNSRSNVFVYAANFMRYLRQQGMEMVAPQGLGEDPTPQESVSYQQLTNAGLTTVTNAITFAGSVMYMLPKTVDNTRGMTVLHHGMLVMQGAAIATQGMGQHPDKKYTLKSTEKDFGKQVKGEYTQSLTITRETITLSPYLADDAGLRVGVNFRTTDDLGISDTFVLYQTDWQRAFELSGGSTPTFEEKAVYAYTTRTGTGTGSKTMPYPGYAAWETGSHFKKITEDKYVNNDASGSVPKPRTDAAYKKSELPVFEDKPLKGNYSVNQRMSS